MQRLKVKMRKGIMEQEEERRGLCTSNHCWPICLNTKNTLPICVNQETGKYECVTRFQDMHQGAHSEFKQTPLE